LLDIKLGNEDGRNITNRIKLNVTTKHIPVILFSAINGIDKNLAKCLNDDFVPKPFDVNDLLNKIQFQIQSVPVTNSIIDEQQLIRMSSYKPIEVFGFFYDKYGAILFGYILSITKNEKQSEVNFN
jgi:DNA-binding response OmpR family regulator